VVDKPLVQEENYPEKPVKREIIIITDVTVVVILIKIN
jgi:hypothetical protein